MTKRKKQCTCYALMAGECVCGAWDDTLAPIEPFITIKELKQEYQEVRRKYSDFKLAVDALVCLLTAAKKAGNKRQR